MKRNLLLLLFLAIFSSTQGQKLKPGYNQAELAEVMCVSARTGGSSKYVTDKNFIAEPRDFTLIYRSGEIGLLNMWSLWASQDGRAIITIRGTTAQSESWLANFYAAMVPAKGWLTLGLNDTVRYELASDPKAAVHVGWLISSLFLAREIVPKIDSCYKAGIKDFIITGHSQGGGIAYILTAYLLKLKENGRLPTDLRFKTYCTAAPKPGNLYFAYDYELATQGGWAFNVVSTVDWVPEVPFSVQTVNDYNEINPFLYAKDVIKKQKFPKNLVLRHLYNKLDKPTKKAQRNFEKYLGEYISKQVGKRLPGVSVPGYYHSNHFVRTGTTILLKPTPEYYERFPAKKGDVFVNHYHQPYLFLIDKTKLEK